MVIILLATIFLILLILIGGAKTYSDFLKGHGLTAIFSVYFCFVLIDLFIPALAMIITGEMPNKPPYIPKFTREDVAFGALVGGISFAFIYLGYLTGYALVGNSANKTDNTYIIRKRALFILVLSLTIYLITQLNVIELLGGPVEYFLSMVKFRRSVFEANETFSQQANALLAAISRDVALSLCAIIFAERRTLRLRRTAWFLVVVGFLVSASTFYRGTLLLFGLMLLAGQHLAFRKQVYGRASHQVMEPRKAGRRQRRKLIWAMSLVVIVFTAYGSGRSYISAKEWGVAGFSVQDGISKEFRRFKEGAGLYSLVHIVHAFPNETEYLSGSTLINQAVRYVPRSILENKPKNYGAYEITAALGYPNTGEAVTIPGETWANFGLFGLPLATLFGVLFGYLGANRYRGRVQYFYLSMGMSIILAIGWFSFTGFMSWLPSALTLSLCLPIISGRKVVRRSIQATIS